uniref:hypothetical protein n=1 Tax=Agathobacter sp. TaxID=2021311 RepID=UPI004055AAD9
MHDIGIQELEYLRRQYKKLPYGKEREEAIRHAIKRADEFGNQEWRLCTRDDLICLFCLWGDNGEMLPILSEFVSIFEEQPMEKYVVAYLDSLYRALHQWIYFPYLPLKERKKMAQHFLQACKHYHANLYEYYTGERAQCLREGKMEEAEKYHKKSLTELQKNSPRKVVSCKACKQASKVYYAIDKKDWETAIKEAQPIFDGTVTCKQHPRETARALLKFTLDSGDCEKSDVYAELFELFPKPDWEDHSWTLMRYYAFTQPEEGLEIFCEVLPYILGVRDQIEQKGFYEDAYIFWVQYARRYENISLTLPKAFPLYREDGMYRSSEIADWLYEKTMSIIKKFDERNGYPYYQNSFHDMIEGMKKMEQASDISNKDNT